MARISKHSSEKIFISRLADVELIILGTIQDAGSPHIACMKDCCRNIFLRPVTDRKVVSLGVVDHKNKKSYLELIVNGNRDEYGDFYIKFDFKNMKMEQYNSFYDKIPTASIDLN